MKKQTMQERPDFWAAMFAWLATHRNEAGYSALAFIMSILATSRNKKAEWKDRIAGALMCGIICFFAKSTLTALFAIFNWPFAPDLCWPISAAVGYIGVDPIFNLARRRVGLDDGANNANS